MDMKKLLLSLLLILITCTQSFAESSVWKIRKGDSAIYLGGTFHILRQADFPLPDEFEKAYAASDMVVFETDIGKMNEMSTQQKLMSRAIYSDGSTIDQHISSRTYNLLIEYCASNGIPLSQFKQFKPPILVTALAMVELMKLGVSQEGVDMFYYKSAQKDNKDIVCLETIDEQIDYIMGMGKGNEDNLIKHTIDDLKSIKQNYETMVTAWKKGDVETLQGLIIGEFKSKMPELFKKLLSDRNEKWLPMIEEYFGDPKIEFVLVGTAHLVGPEGLVETLSRKGYQVENL
jgi:uncharacterized protein YbaP (TraB family)